MCYHCHVIELREYLDRDGESPFGDWFRRLDATAAAKITVALTRLSQGNFSNVKGVGEGVYENRIAYGPGYRVYFGKDGETLVILLCGGTKKKQSQDITSAKLRWRDYKERKRKGLL